MSKEDLEEAWQLLSDREKIIISKRFGLYGDKPETLYTVGKRLGVSRERVRQLQNGALSKLRRATRSLASGAMIVPRYSNGATIPAAPVPKPQKKRVKKVKRVVETPPPEQTDAVRLDYLEAEIKTRSLYIDWSDSHGWKLKNPSELLYATNLRRLIDAAIAKGIVNI